MANMHASASEISGEATPRRFIAVLRLEQDLVPGVE
jgi:hypothetical protein